LEAQEFAEYVYKVHYVYSHLTLETFIGYPSAGLDLYFQKVAYNMRKVGSLAINRALGYDDTYLAYLSDYEARLGAYQSRGQAKIGSNLLARKYSKGFFEAMRKINFSGVTNFEGIGKLDSASLKSQGLSSAEISSLGRANNLARRVSRDAKNKEAFNKALLNNQSFQQSLAKRKNKVRSSAPLDQISIAKLGAGGFKKLNNSLGNLNASINNLNANMKKRSKSKSSFGNVYTSPAMSNIPNYNSPSTSSNFSMTDDELESSKNKNDTGLSGNQIGNLLSTLKADKSLRENGEFDGLFKIVSKAYKRNYVRVLRPKLRKKSSKVEIPSDEPTDKEKAQLRKLLKQ